MNRSVQYAILIVFFVIAFVIFGGIAQEKFSNLFMIGQYVEHLQ